MEMKSTDLSAKLMATENVTVVRANTRTASFDIKSRVLTLPMWKDMTPEIEDMLVGHEVGHALYTDEQKYLKPIEENRKLMGYMNVLEDVRIEKLIKRKYPGLRKRMNEGYKQLNDRDFFGVKKIGLEDLLLIDRINLYFKAGFQCGVTFSPEEKVFVNRAERTETVEEVVELSKDIWVFSKEQMEERKKNMTQQNPEDTEEEEEEDSDYQDDYGDFNEDIEEPDYDEDFKDIPPTGGHSKAPQEEETEQKDDVSDEELQSKTMRSFQDNLDDLADQHTQYVYHEIIDSPIEHVVGYKQILKQTSGSVTFEELGYYQRRMFGDDEQQFNKYMETATQDFNKFRSESSSTVNYLIKEFEMKKSAQLYKRAQTSKIGSLDMKKVWSYQLNEDLFKRVTTIPAGKNHGMIFLLDWSGSMDHVLDDTLKQIMNLAMFCNRAQIQYRVLAFTTQYQHEDLNQKNNEYSVIRDFYRGLHDVENRNVIDTFTNFHLLELFNSKMSSSDFNTMCKRLLDVRFRWTSGFETGGTPLNEALAWVYLNLGKYMKAGNIEKMSLITLSDGQGGGLSTSHRNGFYDTYSDYVDGQYKRIKVKHFYRDNKTQKTYEIRRDSTQQTDMLLRLIKDHYDISVLGFYVCRNNRRDLHSAIRDNIVDYSGDSISLIERMRKGFRDDGFFSLSGSGHNELYIIPQSSTKIVEGELKADSDMKAAALAKNFGKFLNIKKTSRVLLNNFIGYIA